MRFTLPLLSLAILLAACGSPRITPEQRAEREMNRAHTKAAMDQAKTVTVNGKTFRVAHVTQRSQALVDLVGSPAPYFAADIEAASRAATGCRATFDPGILAFISNDIARANLAELRTKVPDDFSGWSVSLDC